MREPGDGGHHVCALVHDNYSASTEPGLSVLQRVVIHPSPHLSARWIEHQHAHSQDFLALGRREDRDGASARNYTKQVVPPANDTSAVFLHKLLQRDTHLLCDNTRVVDVSTDTEEPSFPDSTFDQMKRTRSCFSYKFSTQQQRSRCWQRLSGTRKDQHRQGKEVRDEVYPAFIPNYQSARSLRHKCMNRLLGGG